MSFDLANLAGLLGAGLIVVAYAYNTAKGEQTNPFVQHGLNFVGASLLIASLLVHTNLPSLLLEGIWACVAVWGLAKAFSNHSPSRKRERSGVGRNATYSASPPSSPLPPAGGGE
ncbi:CBU_0592 family membrane protein [Croceibacterium salegens]|uniref:CBU_0592 family membrane protein n=1 Tax=Croceibacterium salegens TaxID=1737568 RepID=UPI002E2558A1